MENGSFQTPFSETSGLGFREDEKSIKTQAPRELARKMTSQTKSSTVEALLAQNEDLMARLKVTLRRLTSLESENEQLQEQDHQVRLENAALSDQLLIWKEKESFWREKNQKLETDMSQIRARYPELDQMEDKIERYKKYHEKIRHQVKPYIQQLKAYAQNLTLEIRKLNHEIEQKEARRLEVEKRVRDLRTEMEARFQSQDLKTQELVGLFEQEKQRLQLELSELRKINLVLEEKADRLDASLLRQDELENTIISLKRLKEESEAEALKTIRNKDEELSRLRMELGEEHYKNKDLETKYQAAYEDSERQRHRADVLQEQLTSLRYLWTNKCSETEKLQLTLQSLEKVNQELSARLNQLRKGEATL